MAQVYKKLEIDVNKEVTSIITAVQNDAKSRYLDVVLLDGSTAINLTGHEVRIYGKKADGTEFYNNGAITSATAGRCQFELTSQALAVANDLEVQIILYKNNVEILSTQPFKIHVVKSLIAPSAIPSSNEYGALVVLYQNLYEAYDLMTTMVQNIGVPGEIAEQLSIDTMWSAWEYMCDYVTRTMQLVVDASLNQGSIMDNGNLYLPQMKFEPLITETETYPSPLYAKFATSSKFYCISGTKVVIYDAETQKKLGETPEQTGACEALYVADDKIYYSDRTTKKIVMFDDNTYLKLGETLALEYYASAMVIADGKLYASEYKASYSTILIVFDSVNLLQIGNIVTINHGVKNMFVDTNILYAGTVSGGIYLYDVTTTPLNFITRIESTQSRINVVVNNGIVFCTDYNGKKVYLYDVSTRLKIGETEEQSGSCHYLFVENGIIYFVCSGNVFLIDVATRENMDEKFEINTGTTYAYVKNASVYWSIPGVQPYKATKYQSAYQIAHYGKKVIE